MHIFWVFSDKLWYHLWRGGRGVSMEFPVEATGLRGANTTVPRGPREALETKTHSQQRILISLLSYSCTITKLISVSLHHRRVLVFQLDCVYGIPPEKENCSQRRAQAHRDGKIFVLKKAQNNEIIIKKLKKNIWKLEVTNSRKILKYIFYQN